MANKTWEMYMKNPKYRRQLLDQIFDKLREGVVITDREGKVLYVNQIYEQITGIPKEVFLTNTIEELREKGYLEVNMTEKVVAAKKIISRNVKTPNGREIFVSGSPFFDEKGEVELVISTIRDITRYIDLNTRLETAKGRAALYQKQYVDDSGDRDVVCDSEAFQEVLRLAEKVAEVDSSVLILGETGTGKEVVTQHIYEHSGRKGKPYIKVNCGAIAPSLLQSELFGYVTGAFTGADPKGKIGLFEMADGGILFLDEIGELPVELQSALLRVLDDGKVVRVGGTSAKKVDVRIIAATNRDLKHMIEKQTFRSDLYYRLDTVSIRIPPLRERPKDIPGLARRAVEKLNQKYGSNKMIEPDFIEELKHKKWLGNVRELENYVEKYYILAEEGWVGDSAPHALWKRNRENTHEISLKQAHEERLPTYQEAREDMERELLGKAMELGGSTYQAAKLLGMNQSTFYRKYKVVFPDAVTD